MLFYVTEQLSISKIFFFFIKRSSFFYRFKWVLFFFVFEWRHQILMFRVWHLHHLAMDGEAQESSSFLLSGTYKLQSPISSLLEYSGILRVRPEYPYSEAHPLIPSNNNSTVNNVQSPSNSELINSGVGVGVDGSGNTSNNREVSIRIIGVQDRVGVVNNGENDVNGVGLGAEEFMSEADDVNGYGVGSSSNDNNNRETSSYQRYDIQQVARWIEQILPFLLLLLVVFIRQHLQGIFVTIYITAILYKSNDILRKQTALKIQWCGRQQWS